MSRRFKYLAVFLLSFLLQFSAWAQEYTPAEDFDYEIVGGNVVITNYKGEQATVNVPPQIDGKNVVAIGKRAFKENYNLTGITLPEGITNIGEGAFDGCTNLATVTFPTSLTSIGAKAFRGTMLTEVQILAGVASIGARAFSNCGNLVSISVSADNPNYSSSEDGILFDKNKTLLIQYPGGKEGTSYVLPTSVRRVGTEAFARCFRLTSVTLNEGLQVLETKAFGPCRNLAEINFPTSLTTIGDWVFLGCDFVEIELPATVAQIGEGAFAEGWSLVAINVAEGNQAFCSLEGVLFDKNMTRLIQYPAAKPDEAYAVPSSVTVIGGGAFDGCMNHPMDVQFLGAVSSIGEKAFYLCGSLNAINLPPSLVSLGKAAFMDCWKLSTVSFPAALQQIPDRCFMFCNNLTHVEFSEGLKSIGREAFMGCSIDEITLPASLIAMGEQVFDGVPAWQARSPLSEYKLAAGNTAFLVHEGVLYSADGKQLIDCPQGKTGSYQLRPGTETIGPYAFSKSGLDGSVVIPGSVTQIAVNAFAWSGWMEPILQEAYFQGDPPAIFVPEEVEVEEEEENFGGPEPPNNYSVIFVYGSDRAAAWEAALSQDGTLAGFTVRELSGGAPAFVKIARQDGVTGEMAAFFSGSLKLTLTAESSDLTDLQLHYLLFEELEEAWGEPIPTTEDDFVAHGGEVNIDATARIKVAPYRNGELCGPVVQQIYRDMSEIATALNAQGNLEFITTPHAPWTVKTGEDYNGQQDAELAVSSVAGTYARPSQLQTTVTGPGCLVFWWRCDDRWNHKQFAFLDNDILVFSPPGGQTAWVKMRYQVPEGEHALTWQIAGEDTSAWGWYYDGDFLLDHVSWHPGENLGFIFEVEDESARVVDYLGTDLLVTVPATDGDARPVVGLDRWAFSYNTAVRGVILPENLNGVDIPVNAFEYCPALNSLFFPGNPPASFPNSALWRTFYYPVDNSAAWDGYFEIMTQWGMAESYRQAWQPISYPLVSAPSITRVGGEPEEHPDCFAGSVSVRLSSEAGTVVRYTTDGSIPTAESLQPPNPLQLTNTTTLTARAFREVAGVLQPCSAFSRRTLVNPVNFNQAIGVGTDTITFATDGDVPWKIYNREDAQGVPNDVIGTGPIFPGQHSTLYATFTLEEEGIFAYKQYYRNRSLPYKWQLYDRNGQPVATKETDGQLGNNWYRYTMTLANSAPLPPGTYTMVWCLEIPLSELNYQNGEAYHSCFLDDFSVGAITVLLTVQCDPQAGGRITADGFEGSSFNKLIGQNVALQVHESDNYLFREWQDDYTYASRTITIKDPEVDGANANTYTAYFDEAAYIKVAAEPSEAASIHGGYRKYVLGEEVSLTVSPANGWRFLRWSDDEQLPEAEPIPANRSFICKAEHHNQTFTAIFVRCITVNGQATRPQDGNPNWWISGGGTVEGFGTHDVEDPAAPTLITLTATPESENFAFQWWDDNGNRIIDPEESTSPVRELSLIWNDVKSFYTTARFQQTAPVVIDYTPGSEGLGQITISKDGVLLPLEDFRGEGCRLVPGTVLVLTATPNENCRFKGWWRGYSYQQGSPLEIEVKAGANNYHADFAQLYPVQVTLAPNSPEGCSARVLLDGVDQGLNSWQEVYAFLTLEAVCAPHYRARWEGGIDNNTIWRNVSATPAENIFQVEFIPTYTVNLASSPDPCPGASFSFNTQTFDLGTESNFSAYGNNYWRFLRWNDGVTDNNRTLNPAESGTYSFTAFFERYVRIACQAESTNFGNYCGNSTFEGAGDIAVTDVPKEVTITAVPGEGFRFDRWTDAAADALPDKTNPVRVFNISIADTLIQLKANFIKTQMITVGVKPGTETWGAITEGARDNVPVDYGTEISFTATPNPNCQFIRWSDYVTEPNRTLTVEYDYVYLAEFASEAPVNIYIQAGQEDWGCQAGVVGSDGSLAASGNFAVGVWHKLEARPAENHRFVRWSDNNYHRTRHIRLTDEGFEVTAIFAQTANLTLEFQTSPDPLPEGIEIPYWRCWLRYPATGYGFYYTPGTYVVDVGTCTLSYYAYGNWTVPATEEITLTVGENKTLTKTFELITTGTVTGYLNPSEITGKWRVKGTEEWCDSSSTLTLEQGDYEIEFQPVNGWLTPADQTITITANRHTSFTGVYSAIVPGVELTFSPSEVSEAAGPSATIATLRRVALEGNPIDLKKSLTVYLSVSENNALILPASSIIIPAGRSLTQFPVGVVDNAIQEDFLQDGDGNNIGRGRIVTLSGRVAMAASCNCNGLPINDGVEQALEADLIIWDNDSPALSVTVAPSTLPEREEAYPQALTVARNEEVPGAAVQVELSAFITDKTGVSKLDTGLDEEGNPVGTEIEFWKDGARLPFKTAGDPSVSLVMIPAGQASVKIDIVACDDGKEDGNQVVSIFADADEYAPGSGWVMISDQSFPDYVISNVATPDTVLESGSMHYLQISLSNNGKMPVPNGLSVPLAIHASRNDVTSNQTLLLETMVPITENQPLPKNGTIDITVEVPLDNLFPADDWRFSVIVNPKNTLREVSNLNNQTWSDPFAVTAGYITQLDVPTTASILPDESLLLTGFVSKSLEDQTRVPGVPVEVYFICGQFRRTLQTESAADGTFSVEFVPTPTEIGRIIAGSCYPGTQTNVQQQEFDVLGFKYNAGGNRYLKWDLTVNTPKTYTITLQNPNLTRLTGIRGAVIDAQGNEEADVELEFSVLPDALGGGDSQNVTFQITATVPSEGRDYERPVLRFASNEGAQLDIPVYLYVISQFADLALEPVSIDTTMQIDVVRQIEVTLSNGGAVETGPITVTVPVLSWLTLLSGSNMPSIPPGESATITIQLKGDESTALGAPFSGAIAINAENVQHGIRLPFRVTAVSEDKGSLQVTAKDEFTFNAKEEADRKNVENATVIVKNPYTGEVLATGNTGETGVCLLENLPVGKCLVIVSADKHESNQQVADIAPGAIVKLDAFLPYLAISYSWGVVSTEIEDEYEIVLNVVYEVNVPMPVVETNMPTNFIDMAPGSVRMVNAILTNKGLINANEVRLDIADAGDFTFEYSQPDDGFTLAPQQSYTVPIIVRRNSATRASDCYTRSVTSYYYECGKDHRWHRYTKKIDLLYCPRAPYNPRPPAGPAGPGFPSRTVASVTTPPPPPPPSAPESCVPCQKGLWNAAIKCGIGFIPGVGCVSGIIDAIYSLKDNYNQGVEGWINIITDGNMAGIGCAAEGTAGMIGNVLGCIKSFMDACDGLEGKEPVPFPFLGGDGYTTGGTRGGDSTRGGGEASWMKALQDKMYWAYRQGAGHESAIREFYGDDIWLQCEAPQLNAFNEAFGQLSKKTNGVIPVVQENAPQLLAVLPANLDSDHLAAFVARWNRTMAYWATLPGGENADIPGDKDGNGQSVINMQKLLGIAEDMELCETEAQDLGYADINALMTAMYADALEYSKNSSSVCATVSLDIKQKITMTREAFEGTLTMSNGHETLPIEQIGLELKVTDASNKDCTHLFEIYPLEDKFNGISALDGTGKLGAKATGSAMVRFIPERDAAPETPVPYNFGGTLTYKNPFSGVVAVIELMPVTLTVNPSPSLQVHYFLQRDILGDDPLTVDVIEPSYPAELSALVYNDGYGEAKNFRIDSGQPKITDNQKGLLIDFSLWDYETEQSMLNGTPNAMPLGQVNLGNIGPKKSGLAQWWLTSSLLGHFVGMEASYSHLSSNGNPDLSLIESVSIHELIRSGHTLDGEQVIFLVNDEVDANDIPDTLWFEKDASSEPVLSVNHEISTPPALNASDSPATYEFGITVELPGWHYIRIDDPGEGLYEIVKTERDGIELPFRNCWLTDRTLPDGQDPIYEDILHLLDYLEPGTYSYVVTVSKLPVEAVEVLGFAAFSSNNENVKDYVLTGDIDEITVRFNTSINPETFSSEDLILRRQGVLVGADELAEKIVIAPAEGDEANLTFVMSGFGTITNQDGFYVLTVQCAGIADSEGYFGKVGRQLMWIRQHDFAGGEPPPPSLLSLERIVPEAGMDGEFDIKLTFLGNIKPSSVTVAGFYLKRNGEDRELDVANLSIVSSAEPGVFLLKGLETPDDDTNFYSLRFDASTVEDMQGTKGTGMRATGWGTDATPPAPVADMTLSPDSGLDATDRVLMLAANEQLQLTCTLPELPCSWQLLYRADGVAEWINLTEEFYVPEGGSTALAHSFNLPEGAWNLLLRVWDEARNFTDNTLDLTIDNTPADPLLNHGITPDSGIFDDDYITALADGEHLVFTGTVPETPCRLQITCRPDGGNPSEPVIMNFAAGADADFEVDFGPLAEVRHVVDVLLTDLAGNQVEMGIAFKIDNTPPVIESFDITPDLGLSDSDLISSAKDYTVKAGINETPVQVMLAVNGQPFQPVNLEAVGFFAKDLNLDEGEHRLTLTVKDYAGNQTSAEKTLKVDRTAPGLCQNLAITPDTGTPGDLLTSAREITLTGTLPEIPLQVELLVNEISYSVQMFEENTALSLPVSLTADGGYQLTVRCTDIAGNTTDSILDIRVDSQAPALPDDLKMLPDTGNLGDWQTKLPDGEQLTITGTLQEKLLQVRIFEGEELLDSKDCLGDDQDLLLAFTLAEGRHSLALEITDPAGNSSERNLEVVIDNTAPAAVDLSVTPDTGRSDSDKITSPTAENPLVLNATLPETSLHAAWFYSTAEEPDALKPLGEKQFAEADGTQFQQALPALADGQYQFTLRLTDAAGNSSDSLLAGILLDTTAPEAATALAIAPDTGIAGDFRTQLAEGENLTVTGNLVETLLQVEILEGEEVLAEYTCVDEEQAFTMAFPLPEGEHALTVRLTDIAGNSTGSALDVVIDNTAPTAAIAAILPDHGESATDSVTCLLEGENLSLSITVAEVPLTLHLGIRLDGAEEFMKELVVELDEGDELIQILPLMEIIEGGIYTAQIRLEDPAGNSTESELQFELDTAPLTVAFSALPGNPADADALLVTFNAPVVETDITLDILTVTYNGQQVTGMTLEKVSPAEYRLHGLKTFALNVRADGEFALTLDLSQVSKLRSGLPGQGTDDENWQFLFDRFEEFAWQPGWNALQLNFSKLTIATEEMLQAMPRMLYDAAKKTFVRPQEQDSIDLGVPLWVFCADAKNMAEPSGIWQDFGSSLEDIPKKTWVMFSPNSRIELGDNVTAWKWINGKYEQAEVLMPGHVYWILTNPE